MNLYKEFIDLGLNITWLDDGVRSSNLEIYSYLEFQIRQVQSHDIML